MIEERKIANRFISDIDTIARDFIKCFNLKHTAEVNHLSEPLLRWLDFRLRYVDPKPRQIYLSKVFPKKMSVHTRKAAEHLLKMIQSGKDINPYQGKGLILYHDASEDKRKKRTDLLWADWGIVHLHLTTQPVKHGKYFSARSKWLLFALFGEGFCAVIDIRHHDEKNLFANEELVKLIVESWPELMARYELQGVTAPTETVASKDRVTLREGGVASIVSVGDKVYMGPGMGVTTASTPIRVSLDMNNIRRYALDFARDISNVENEIQGEIRSKGINKPEFQLCITPRGMAVYEANLDSAWLLPRKEQSTGFNYLASLSDLVAPLWAVEHLTAISKKSDSWG